MTRPRALRTGVALVLLALAVAGCRLPATLDPAGAQAERLAELIWGFTAVCATVYVLVLAALGGVTVRRYRGDDGSATAGHLVARHPERERRMAATVVVATVASALVLTGLLVASVITDRGVGSLAGREGLEVEVVGHQWWWEIRYPGDQAAELVTTANEIHLPVGEVVHLELTSADVIHSFWVPRLHGKKDLIPGRTTFHALVADRPGIYHGQCAEFCGHQHAHMGLVVVAEPRPRFDAWLAAQRRAARSPGSDLERRGRQVFLRSSCGLCHTVRGTQAGGRTAPDLTHLASRGTLAAATLRNEPARLAAWIRDPHGPKPYVNMPPNEMPEEDLRALVAYLGSLR